MEENTEAIHLHHVPEGQPRSLRHEPGCPHPCQRAHQRDQPQNLLTRLFVEQRFQHHHDHAEKRENNLGQDTYVIGTLRKRLQKCRDKSHDDCPGDHCLTTLLTTCVKGVSAARTAGSMAPSHRIGATPITSAAAAQGQSASFSKPERSRRELFTGCVTLP